MTINVNIMIERKQIHAAGSSIQNAVSNIRAIKYDWLMMSSISDITLLSILHSWQESQDEAKNVSETSVSRHFYVSITMLNVTIVN